MLKGYLTCETVAKLVPFYIDDKLPEFQSDCVAIHLRNCPTCMQKYSTIRKFLQEVKAKHNKKVQEEKLFEDLSAHFDGEESKSQMLSVEVMLQDNEDANKKYERISYLSKLLSSTFRDEKGRIEIDFTDKVMAKYKKQGWVRRIFQRITNLLQG